MIPLNFDKFDEGAISTFENETGETYIDLTELCATMGVMVTEINDILSLTTIGERDGVEHLVVDEKGFFRAVFLIMEAKKNLYASEIIGLTAKLNSNQ